MHALIVLCSPLIPLPPAVYGALPAWLKVAFLLELPLYNPGPAGDPLSWVKHAKLLCWSLVTNVYSTFLQSIYAFFLSLTEQQWAHWRVSPEFMLLLCMGQLFPLRIRGITLYWSLCLFITHEVQNHVSWWVKVKIFFCRPVTQQMIMQCASSKLLSELLSK